MISKLGVIGTGQLGRMLGQAKGRGADLRFLQTSSESIVDDLGYEVIKGDVSDLDVLKRFADGLDCVTFEWENVSLEVLDYLQSQKVMMRPNADAIKTAQNRVYEKGLFYRLGIPTPEYAAFNPKLETMHRYLEILDRFQFKAVIKTATGGYDGKGQWRVENIGQAIEAFPKLSQELLIIEKLVVFKSEVSMLAVRSVEGSVYYYPLVQNYHHDGILRVSTAPSPHEKGEIGKLALKYTRQILEQLDYVGVIAVEFFVGYDGKLYANEIAPRVHNSGHGTIEAAKTSQFENHIRAVTGTLLGIPTPIDPSIMINFIGKVDPAEVQWRLKNRLNYNFHWYGKKEARPGRKMGHVTIVGDTVANAIENGRELLSLLVPNKVLGLIL